MGSPVHNRTNMTCFFSLFSQNVKTEVNGKVKVTNSGSKWAHCHAKESKRHLRPCRASPHPAPCPSTAAEPPQNHRPLVPAQPPPLRTWSHPFLSGRGNQPPHPAPKPLPSPAGFLCSAHRQTSPSCPTRRSQTLASASGAIVPSRLLPSTPDFRWSTPPLNFSQ